MTKAEISNCCSEANICLMHTGLPLNPPPPPHTHQTHTHSHKHTFIHLPHGVHCPLVLLLIGHWQVSTKKQQSNTTVSWFYECFIDQNWLSKAFIKTYTNKCNEAENNQNDYVRDQGFYWFWEHCQMFSKTDSYLEIEKHNFHCLNILVSNSKRV